MTDSIRRGLKTHIAGLLDNDIRYQRSNYYYFLGKTYPWDDMDVVPTNNTESYNDERNIRTDSIFYKKVSPSDISIVTTRYDWVTGTVYKKWDHTKDMIETNFYCVTDNNAIYKCLDNNGGSVSTVKPQDKSFSVFRTSDGYLWKYMYTIPEFKYNKFSSADYIPVQKSLTNSFYNNGSIDQVIIVSNGYGYLDTPMTTIGVSTATTTGIGGVASIVTDENGVVIGYTITNGGSGYIKGAKLSINSETGYGSVIAPIITDGVIVGIEILSGGSGYINNSQIIISVGGAILVPSISRISGSIDKVKIIDGGSGYMAPPTLTIYNVSGVGSGKYGNASAILSAVIHNGKIVSVNVIDPGIEYSTSNDTTITVTGDGHGASLSPVVYNGEIVDIVVENAGINYTNTKVTVSGSGFGASVKTIISASDFISDQSTVEQLAVSGAIYSIEVVDHGTYYSENTTLTITGDGDGCEAYPVIVNGTIQKIYVTKYGKNYSYADVIISDSGRDTIMNSVDAIVYAIFPPNKGHGYDAVSELYGSVLAINSSFRDETGLSNIAQEYRQFGLIKNPTNMIDGRLLQGTSYLITYRVVLDSVIGLLNDEILTIGNTKFRVVSISGGNNVILQQIGSTIKLPFGVLVADSGDVPRTYTSLTVLTQPVANKYSGDVLYVSSSNAFSFNENQSITIKTFLKF